MKSNRTITIPFWVIFMAIIALSFSSTKAYGTSPNDSSSISQQESTDSLQNGTMISQHQNEVQQNTADFSAQQCDNSSTDDVIDDENPKQLSTKELISYIILIVNLLLILTLLVLFIVYNHKSKKSSEKSLKAHEGKSKSTKNNKKDKNEDTNDSLGNEKNEESLAIIATKLQQQINSLSEPLNTLTERTLIIEKEYFKLKKDDNDLQDIKNQFDALKDKYTTLDSDYKELKSQKETLETEKHNLQEELAEAIKEKDNAINEALTEQRSQYDEKVKGLNSQLKRYSDYIKDYVSEFKDDSGNNKKLNEIKEAFSSFNKNAAQLFKQIEELNKERIYLNNAVLNDKSISDDDKNDFVQFYSHYVSKYEEATKEINSSGLELDFNLLNQSGMVPKGHIIDNYLKESIRENYIDDLREKAFDRDRLGELCGASVVLCDDLGTALPAFCPNAVKNENKCIKRIKELSEGLRDSTQRLGYTIVTDVTLITKKSEDYPSDKVKASNDDTRLNRKQKFGEGAILEVRKLAVMCGDKGDKETLVITE